MSKLNGDKSRHNRLRKQRVAKRRAIRNLLSRLAGGKGAPAAK